jgi:hypothetical protein
MEARHTEGSGRSADESPKAQMYSRAERARAKSLERSLQGTRDLIPWSYGSNMRSLKAKTGYIRSTETG